MAHTARVEPDGRPAWLRVTEVLRRGISEGAYPVGQKLPSTKQLMTKYGVSLTVVRRAVDELRREGVVIGQPGSGVYVKAQPGPRPPTTDDRLDAAEAELSNLRKRVEALEG